MASGRLCRLVIQMMKDSAVVFPFIGAGASRIKPPSFRQSSNKVCESFSCVVVVSLVTIDGGSFADIL